ncbi:MAG: ROK family protein [Gaiellales bacterium]|nr:MAG: ROK family protein [Gaiellales bacterium]
MAERIVIGVDIGGTTTAAGLVDQRLEVIDSVEQETVTLSQEQLLNCLAGIISGLASRSPAPVAAIGFGIPSMIDRAAGRAVMSVNIPLADIDFVTYMTGRTGLPVFIDNDANVAALAEHRAGAGTGTRQMVMITVGTGIGGGLIIDGSVYRGAGGSAAELGHMVIDVNGPECPGACGNRGCFEAMASGTALRRYALEAAGADPGSALGRAVSEGSDVDGALVSRLAREGDSASAAVMAKVGFYLGVGITSLVNIFNPEVFVVGGGVAQAGELLLEPAVSHLRRTGLRPNRDTVRVVTASLGPRAGMLGAACMALDESTPAD